MIPVSEYAGARVAVLGLGRSGLAAARALREGGAEVLCWDDGETARAKARGEGFALRDLTRPGALKDVAALIASPGIAHLYPAPHPAIAAAFQAGVPVDNDIGLFFRAFPTQAWDNFDRIPRVIAITGSNGKSTTAALVHHVLESAGLAAQLGGNIGRGALDLEPAHDGEVIVLELSSYQIELARALTPDIAVFTNLSPDHLDRHGGRGGYFAAKRRLFAEGGPDRAVIGVDQIEGRFLANQTATGSADDRVIRVSSGQKLAGPGWSVFARKGFLSEYRKGRQVASVDLRDMKGLPGAHNHQNACAAFAACRTLGLAPKVIERAFHSFAGLVHRSQTVAVIDGVRYVNDSKATNVDSAAMALQAFENIHWIAGGAPKEGGIAPLLGQLGNVKAAYLIGAAAPEFAATLGRHVTHEICIDMARAVAQAQAAAQPGDTVLLAPACASFDQYESFEKRGEDFAALVGDIARGAP